MTKIYAWLPADLADPLATRAHLQATRRERAQLGPNMRDDYLELPWPLEEMTGTDWRNIWTGGLFHVEAVTADEHPIFNCDRGRLKMYGGRSLYLDDKAWGSYLGLWWKDRFVIDYTARVDHLPPELRLKWMYVELVHFREELNKQRKVLADLTSSKRWSKRYRQGLIDRAQANAKQVLAQIEHLAAEHSLTVVDDVLNLGRQGQLVLF